MITFSLALALLLQAPDTTPRIYDSPATEELVQRAIAASATVPAELLDYRATVRSQLYITLAGDTLEADIPASVDELVSEVRWNRAGSLHQSVLGHRTRLLLPMPYTMATLLERPWVVPHLYGSAIFTPFAGAQAVNPFGSRGPSYYRYSSDDPIRLRVQGELVTLVPILVRPIQLPTDPRTVLVVGTFFLDADRGAVAQARYGFVGGRSDLPRALGRLETFIEMENGLWEGRYWLPFRQRRDILFSSPILGGAATSRVVNQFTELQLNTGWEGVEPRVQLTWDQVPDQQAFAGWEQAVGEEAARYAASDFSDLQLAVRTETGGRSRPVQVHYERGSHLFRYNRVEGPFLGLGARLMPPDPLRNRWELYGTVGWAFAEGTPRGELSLRTGSSVALSRSRASDYGAELTLYRRLEDIIAFRPTVTADWLYSLPALLWGADRRDYYDAAGVEAFGIGRWGRWVARAGGRMEKQDSVQINTTRFLFGEAGDFGPVAGAEPGTHVSLELGGGYSLGPGAFGIGNSAILRSDLEQGLGDFSFTRLTGLASVRYVLGPITVASRTDAGHAAGGVPPQRLFRFGAVEGLRGYEPNEFGGSTALLTRGRLLLGLPPRSMQPISRAGMFIIPPLRPSLVFLVESGWTWIHPELEDELARLRARPTDGARSAVGVGVSFLDDAITIERLQPIGSDSEERGARWYVGLTFWY